VGALGVAEGQPELGCSPQAAVVMADMYHAGPGGGCKGLEHCWEEASVQPGFGDG